MNCFSFNLLIPILYEFKQDLGILYVEISRIFLLKTKMVALKYCVNFNF